MLRCVPSESSRPIRARNAEEKQQRRTEILKAAERLWENAPYAELSMNQVAREAKLAKGTLYLYYDTKEELFLSLLSEHVQDWFSDLIALLRQQPVTTADELATVLLMSSDRYISLRRLSLLLNTVLDRNIKAESALEFRRLIRRNIYELSQLLNLPPQNTMEIVAHFYALMIGWHQTGETPSIIYSTSDTEIFFHRPDFSQQLELAVRAVLQKLYPDGLKPRSE